MKPWSLNREWHGSPKRPLDTAAFGMPAVVGNFNDWTPGAHVLRRRSNGTRSVSVTVPTGSSVHFRYLGENGLWFDDPDAAVITDTGGVVQLPPLTWRSAGPTRARCERFRYAWTAAQRCSRCTTSSCLVRIGGSDSDRPGYETGVTTTEPFRRVRRDTAGFSAAVVGQIRARRGPP